MTATQSQSGAGAGDGDWAVQAGQRPVCTHQAAQQSSSEAEMTLALPLTPANRFLFNFNFIDFFNTLLNVVQYIQYMVKSA